MFALFMFECAVNVKRKKDIFLFIFFFLSICFIFPLTMHPNTMLLRTIFGGVIWAALLLSSFISVDKLFYDDVQDGFIDRYVQFPVPEEAIFFIKAFCFTLFRLVSLTVILPFIALLYHISLEEIVRIIIIINISAPAILFFGAFAALLTAHLQTATMIIFILTFPLILPAIIFGAGSILSDAPLWSLIKLPLAFSLFSCSITILLSRPLIKLLHDTSL